MEYTITLTDAEVKALQYAAVDNHTWIENAAVTRAIVAKDEILELNTKYCNQNEIAIAVGEAAQIDQAYELGVVRTLKEVSEENARKVSEENARIQQQSEAEQDRINNSKD